MGVTGQSITLANSIIGVGILAMPFCFQQCGVVLATLILMSMGLMSRLCCYFLLKSAIITRRRNFEFLAFHVFGPAGKMAVETGIIGFLMGTCIAYFVVVGDLGPQIIAKLLHINQSDILRTSIMVIVSLVCVLPLGLLRNVDSLSNVSAATIAFYFCLVLKVITEATTQLFTTDWYTRIEMWKPEGVLQCVPIFSMALFCQTQLFEIFESMPSASLDKMCLVTKNAIHICAAVYFTLGLFGYIAFSSQEISGNILMSLSPTWASDVIKLGFVMSLAFSFPLIIFPCRASLYSFLYRKEHPSHHDHIITHSIPSHTFRLMTVGIVCSALVVSLLLPNVELVLGLLGATVGVLVCVVFPAACFLHVTYKDTNERLLAKFVVVLGLFILVLGTYANLQAAENTHDKYDISKERIDKIVEDYFHKIEQSEVAIVKLNVDANKDAENKKVSDIIKDSEVQPPNPVPPESQSIEKTIVIKPEENEKEEKPNETLTDTKDNTLIKETESHPRNLKLKANDESVDKSNQVPNVDLENNNLDSIKLENLSNSQEKLYMLKQQKLADTIKQHGEEQKELIKEQKGILEEILKTKKELEIKKEEENNEAKKLAVESIQKIANMAIQSISGVSENPNLKPAKQPDPIQNIANAAVINIAKKAAETLDAIKQIDKPSDEQPNANIGQNEKLGTIILKQIAIPGQQNVSSVLVNENKDNKLQEGANQNKNGAEIKNANMKNNQISQKQIKKTNATDSLAVEDKNHEIKTPNKTNTNLKSNEAIKSNANEEKVNNNNQLPPIPIIAKEKVKSGKELKDTSVGSNKLGQEDTKNKKDIVEERKEENIVSGRQKREVVDCTNTKLLQPEDKQICENIVNKPVVKESDDILPDVDLGEIALSKKIPADILSMHHIRSLKSLVEDKKR